MNTIKIFILLIPFCVLAAKAQTAQEVDQLKSEAAHVADSLLRVSDRIKSEISLLEDQIHKISGKIGALQYTLNSERKKQQNILEQHRHTVGDLKRKIRESWSNEEYLKYFMAELKQYPNPLIVVSRGEAIWQCKQSGSRRYEKSELSRKQVEFFASDISSMTQDDRYNNIRMSGEEGYLFEKKLSENISYAVVIGHEVLLQLTGIVDFAGWTNPQTEAISMQLSAVESNVPATDLPTQSKIDSLVAERTQVISKLDSAKAVLNANSELWDYYDKLGKDLNREYYIALTSEQYQKNVAELTAALTPKYGQETAKRVADHELWIGMTEQMLMDGNYEVKFYFVSDKYKLGVYHNFIHALYLEIRSGKVTEISSVPLTVN